MQEIFDAISAARRALNTVEGFAMDYLGIAPPVDAELPAVELPTSPTVQGADDLVIAPSNALDALVSEGDAWEVTDLSSPAGVMFTGHRHQCEAWAFDNCAAGFSIRPHTPS